VSKIPHIVLLYVMHRVINIENGDTDQVSMGFNSVCVISVLVHEPASWTR